MAALILTVEQVKNHIKKLRRIAQDVEDTAKGSSRASMYLASAQELRGEADSLESCIR